MSKLSTLKHMFQIGIAIDIENLREYRDLLEDSLEEQLRRFSSDVENWALQVPAEVREEFYEHHADSHWKLSEVFPNTLRASLFVTCCSFLESELVDLCQYVSRKANHPTLILFDDFRVQEPALRRVKYYLQTIGIAFPENVQWRSIQSYQKIRNVVVHNGGRLDLLERAKRPELWKAFTQRQQRELGKQRDSKKIIDSIPSLSLDGMNNIQFSKEFCSEVIDTLEGFFKELYKALPDKLLS